MSGLLSERNLFYGLLLFWFVGLLLLIGYHPYHCIFFPLPPNGSGPTSPENPHENPSADWFYNFTHVITLTPYTILCCLLQLLLFTCWYLQLSHHERLQTRIAREVERGKEMRQAGWIACIKSMCDEGDLDEDVTHGTKNQQQNGNISIPTERYQGFRCVCGCCYCFSTACVLNVFNIGALLSLIYLLFIGYGTLESTTRSEQKPECRIALPAGVYIYVLNGALVILYIVLLLIRCVCATRSIAQGVVAISKGLHQRVAQRKGRKGKSAYAQLDPNSGDHDIELDLEMGEEDHTELDHDQIGMEMFFENDEDEENAFDDEQYAVGLQQPKSQQTKSPPFTRPPPLAQPKPHRPSPARQLLTGPPGASQLNQSTTNGSGQQLDDDTREMMEMLETKPNVNGDVPAMASHGRQDEI